MKTFLRYIFIILAFLALPLSASALIPLQVNQGGSGVSTITGIIQGNGIAPFSPVTIGTGLNFTSGTLSSTGASNTGTPTQVRYFNASGNDSSDAGFTRSSTGSFDSQLSSITYAQGADQQSNFSTNGVYQADTPGATGDSISLTFNGTTDTYASVLAAWNIANPSNTATLIAGTGTDIPVAQTIQFINGGGTGWQTGTVSLSLGSGFQGSTLIDSDTTSGLVAVNGVGHLGGIIGANGVGPFLFTKDNVSNALSAFFAVPGGLTLLSTDSSTYSNQLNLDDAGFHVYYNGVGFFSQQSSQVGWQDQGSGNRYFLPTSGSFSTGDTLQVSSVSGNDYTLNFAAGSGSLCGNDKDVIYNDSGSCGASDNFTFWGLKNQFSVGDLTTPGTSFFVDPSDFFIKARLNSNSQFQITDNSVTPEDWFNVNPQSQSAILGDSLEQHNQTWLQIFGNNNQIEGRGLRRNVTSAVTYTDGGSGQNDLTPGSGFYGTNANPSYSLVITHINVQYLGLQSVTHPPQVGDVLVGATSGAHGTVYDTDGTSYVRVENVTGGPFVFNENITSQPPAFPYSGQLNINLTGITDAYTLTHVTSSGTFSCNGQTFNTMNPPQCISEGVGATFGAQSGHAIGDQWDWSYSSVFGDMFDFNGALDEIKFGDLTNIFGNGSLLDLNIRTNTATAYFNDFAVRDTSNNPWFEVNSPSSTVTIGAAGFGNGTSTTYDDSAQSINSTADNFQINSASLLGSFASGLWSNSAGQIQLVAGDPTDQSNLTLLTTTASISFTGSGTNGIALNFDDTAQKISAQLNNGIFDIKGFGNIGPDRIAIFDNANRAVTLGDADNDFSGTFEKIDDPSQTFIFSKPNFTIAGVPYVFPGSQGGANTVLTNDGSGNLSWNASGTTTGAFAPGPMQMYTSTGNVTMTNNTRGIIYNPSSTQATATITLPPSPVDNQEVIIMFGGTLTSGTIVTLLTVSPNGGQTILGTGITTATIDTLIEYKWIAADSDWYRID